MHNLLQAVEWSNQKVLGLDVQISVWAGYAPGNFARNETSEVQYPKNDAQ